MRYIIFIYIRQGGHDFKKSMPQVSLRLKCPYASSVQYTLNNYEFIIHHVPIYIKSPKDFNKEKKSIIF